MKYTLKIRDKNILPLVICQKHCYNSLCQDWIVLLGLNKYEIKGRPTHRGKIKKKHNTGSVVVFR